MTQGPSFLDGNAAAGDLAEIFGTDMTDAAGECKGCGQRSRLAQMHVYIGGPGLVIRCPHCEASLLRLVRSPTRSWLDTGGLSYLEIRRPA